MRATIIKSFGVFSTSALLSAKIQRYVPAGASFPGLSLDLVLAEHYSAA